STYLGGIYNDFGAAIVLDGSGNVYVAGGTLSYDFPGITTNSPSSTRTSLGGNQDVFVTKIDASGTNRIYTFLFGGTAEDEATSLAVDAAGHAHVVGWEGSVDFPVTNTVGLLRAANSGGIDAFVSEVNSNGNALVQSAYLGGSGIDVARAIQLDA